MRARQAVLLGGALVALAGVFLPWETTCVGGASVLLPRSCGPASRLQNPGEWRLVALAALLAAGCAALALGGSLALGDAGLARCAALVSFFALATASEVLHSSAQGVSFRLEYGAGVGVLGAAVCAAAAFPRTRPLPARLFRRELAATAAAIVLLASLLFAWERVGPRAFSPFVFGLTTWVAVAVVLVAVDWWADDGAARARRGTLALAAAVGAGGVVSAAGGASLTAWAWVGVSAAGVLVLIGLRDVIAAIRARPVTPVALAAAVLAGGCLVPMFLPWLRECDQAGRCVSEPGWTSFGTITPPLAFATAAAAWSARRDLTLGLALGLAVFAGTDGLSLSRLDVAGVSIEPAAYVTFACAGALVVLAAAWARPTRAPGPAALTGAVLSTAYVAAMVVPWWNVLPNAVEDRLRFTFESWLAIAAALLAIGLAVLWAQDSHSGLLTLVPLAMWALVLVDVVEHLSAEEWVGVGVLLALCALLASLAEARRRGGWRQLELPALLRIDRIV